ERLAHWDCASDRKRLSDDRTEAPSAHSPDLTAPPAAVARRRLAVPFAGNDIQYRPACALVAIPAADCGTEAARSFRSADAMHLPSGRDERKDRRDRIAPLDRPVRADAIVSVRRD